MPEVCQPFVILTMKIGNFTATKSFLLEFREVEQREWLPFRKMAMKTIENH
jgi:hypothetical protein